MDTQTTTTTIDPAVLAAAQASSHQSSLELENIRHQNDMAEKRLQARVEMMRLAKETLIENARSKPVSDRDITPEDISAFADILYANATK